MNNATRFPGTPQDALRLGIALRRIINAFWEVYEDESHYSQNHCTRAIVDGEQTLRHITTRWQAEAAEAE